MNSDQVRALLRSAAGDRLEALFVLAATTGLRQGELFGLHWRDVDLQAETLTVRYTVEELKGAAAVEGTENGSRSAIGQPA